MLNFNCTGELDSSIQEFLRKRPWYTERAKYLTTTLTDDPTLQKKVQEQLVDVTSLKIPNRKFEVLVGLGLLSWYFPAEIGIILRLSLDEIDWGHNSKEAKSFLLTSKEFALAYLILQDRWNDWDFFGNILGCKLLIYQLQNFQWKDGVGRSKVVRPLRRRGHRESHSESFGLPREYFDDLRRDVWYQERVLMEQLEEHRRFLLMKERIERFLAS